MQSENAPPKRMDPRMEPAFRDEKDGYYCLRSVSAKACYSTNYHKSEKHEQTREFSTIMSHTGTLRVKGGGELPEM